MGYVSVSKLFCRPLTFYTEIKTKNIAMFSEGIWEDFALVNLLVGGFGTALSYVRIILILFL